MNALKLHGHPGLWVALAWGLALPAYGAVYAQCPGDSNGDAVIDASDPNHPNAKCMHLSGGDGFVKMGDGYMQYIFGFSDLTATAPNLAMDAGMLAANFPAPTIALKKGQEFYLPLSNAGMVNRPDLFDPHSVHFHGFPNAAPVFDGMPEGSIAINMGASITYYYNLVEPGTFMYHCHVEATEHMQMGMLGNLYVSPAQNELPNGTVLGIFSVFLGLWAIFIVSAPDTFLAPQIYYAFMSTIPFFAIMAMPLTLLVIGGEMDPIY